MNVLQINTVINSGSTGRIAEEIGLKILQEGGESYIAYGRDRNTTSRSQSVKIGSKIDFYFHALLTRIFDLHGFGSKLATKKFIKTIESLNLDLIHIHNIHGYYLHIETLFNYLNKCNLPVVWTLHDCWSFTGHCTHYEFVDCNKWKAKCFKCPQKSAYPTSLLFDNSKFNYKKKKEVFRKCEKLNIVPVSKWLNDELNFSFLADKPKFQIYNGIDLKKFKKTSSVPKTDYDLNNREVVLGVASVWTNRKGFYDFIELRKLLPKEFLIVMIGVTKHQKRLLGDGILGIERTESIDELVKWYSYSKVLFNPTLEDTYPTVNLESIACGTPVVTYNTGGSPESISSLTGCVIEKGNLADVVKAIYYLLSLENEQSSKDCRVHAVSYFDNEDKFQKYIQLYKNLIYNK